MSLQGLGGLVDGLFPNGDRFPSPVTPGRKTRIRFDVKDPVVYELPFGLIRYADEMARGFGSKVDKCRLVPGAGWELTPIQADISNIHEKDVAQSSILKSTVDGGPMQVPVGMLGAVRSRLPSEFGLTAGSGAASTGDFAYRKQKAADQSLGTDDFRLTSDQAAFPGPARDTTYPLDRVARVAVGAGDGDYHDPDHAIVGRMKIPGHSGIVPDIPERVYFSGPPSKGHLMIGKGNYCLEFYGDGQAALSEFGHLVATDTDGWLSVTFFRWCQANHVAGVQHYYEIRPHIYDSPKQNRSGVINIKVGEAGSGTMLSAPGSNFAKGVTTGQLSYYPIYIGDIGEAPPAPDHQPVRRDERQDLRQTWQLSQASYPTEGYVYDSAFTLLSMPGPDSPLQLWWHGKCPGDSKIEVFLFLAGQDPDTDTPLAHDDEVLFSPSSGYKTYTLAPDQRDFQPQAKLTASSDKYLTPTLYDSRPIKDGRIDYSEPGETTGGIFRSLSGIGPDADPSHESLQLVIEDPYLDLGRLLNRSGGMCTVVDTEYDEDASGMPMDWSDPANEGKQSVIFRGYVSKATALHKGMAMDGPGTSGSSGGAARVLQPGPDWREWQIDLAGCWSRASESIAPYGWDFMMDADIPAADGTVLPWKVTNAMKLVLNWAGFPDAMLDIPDFDLRFFAKDGNGARLTTGANLMDFAVQIARDYLGRALVFDPNAGLGADPEFWFGMWRLLDLPNPPYRNLAYFTGYGPGPDGGPSKYKSVHGLKSYPDQIGDGGQKIKGAPFWKRTLKEYTRRPEVNMITVVGNGDIGSAQAYIPGNDVSEAMCVTVYNFKSFDFYPGLVTADDPDHPDYLGRCVPLTYVDTNLSSPAAVQWIARRLYNTLTHGAMMKSFTAPLVLVTDQSDSLQVRPRPLRYQDAVLFEGDQYLIRSVSPFWSRDGMQMAHYEIEHPIPSEEVVPTE